MDRRDFIKLTAVTGTTATLASCGNPEHQLIRFVPDEDLVPGVAEWKPSVCPLCSAGCGVTARVMEADVETVRNGQAGVVKMGVAKKLEGQPGHPISQGGLCPRGQAAIQITFHPDRIAHPLKRTGARGAGTFKEITWDEAIAELTGQLDALAAAGDQKSLAVLARPRSSRRIEAFAAFSKAFGATGSSGLRAVRRRCAAPRQRGELRPRSAADVRSGARPLCDGIWRRFPRHLELAGGAEHVVRTDAPGPARRARQARAGRGADVADRRQRRRMGARQAGH